MQDNKQMPAQQTVKPVFKRRIIFIKKEMQFKYMFLIGISVILGIAIMTFEVLTTLQNIYANYPMVLQPLYDKFIPISLTIGLKMVIFLILVMLVSAILSQKMAGPIYRFEVTCKEIAKGDFSKRVNLRKGDEFGDLQKDFNNMMDVVEAEIKKGRNENKQS
ncbi:Putative methyl-accepting chemotaxis sensory transducer [Elusimicrobium minutum Pei191]|uniref:histidine kinase n=1 Tax=Elusimicrobium minutum (strain Pei191) TaxID=445932 RepID=B2KBV7_ELUMP|nr:HAMP domain-containing protein [Elusimicrobium minutum]ACC97861.1 Putative methyl-accepting chemotaxis sensory transducer [Elusimicrobium minutum Pei191]